MSVQSFFFSLGPWVPYYFSQRPSTVCSTVKSQYNQSFELSSVCFLRGDKVGRIIVPTLKISKLGYKEGSDICPSSLSESKGIKLKLGSVCLTSKEEAVTKARELLGEEFLS